MASTTARPPWSTWATSATVRRDVVTDNLLDGEGGVAGGSEPATAVFFEAVFFGGEAPGGVVCTWDGTALHARLGVFGPEKSVEIVVRSFQRSSLFEAPMSTLFHG